MRHLHPAAASVVLALGLAACAAPPPPPPPMAATAPKVDAALPASAAGGIDGTYRGPPEGTSGNSRCGTTMFKFPIRVAGGMASMSSVMNGTLEGPVAPDGTLAIEKGRAGLRGQFAGGKFNGTYVTGNCSYTLAYTKR